MEYSFVVWTMPLPCGIIVLYHLGSPRLVSTLFLELFMPRIRKYSDEQFIEAVRASFSVRQVLEKLSLNPTGGNYSAFYRRCKSLSIDHSHFTGMLWSKDRILGPKRALSEYLENGSSITSHALRLRLLKEGLKSHACENCGLSEWLGNPIPLELDHINGISSDNRFENLRVLCPNCHYLTPTHRGKNWGVNSKT